MEFLFRVWVSLAVFLLYSIFHSAMPHSILIFGGNGFMGSETSRQLLAAGHQLTLVSRGSWDWDAGTTVKPFVRHIKCDRTNPADAELMMKELDDSRFQMVLDFSAYRLKAVEPFYKWLTSRIDFFYLYISTDSVYEVCVPSNGPAAEDDAVRPESQEDQERLNKLDSYGHKKLEIEEFLIKHAEKGGLPYIILRLPDVIGPRDSTGRFWKYQLWLTIAEKLEFPVPIPYAVRKLRTSYVYSNDVAALITSIVDGFGDPAMTTYQSAVINQVFNIGFPQSKLLREFLLDVWRTVDGEGGAELKVVTETDRTNGLYYFPSVTRGDLDITKATKILNWSPSPWSEALKKIVTFNHQAMAKHPSKFTETVVDLYDDISEFLNDRQKTEMKRLIEHLERLEGQEVGSNSGDASGRIGENASSNDETARDSEEAVETSGTKTSGTQIDAKTKKNTLSPPPEAKDEL